MTNHPLLSRLDRIYAIWLRNFKVWRKLAISSILANIAEPLFMLIAFGYGLGALVGDINGIRYIAYLASGMIAMSVMYAASFEAMYSAYTRMHVQKTWQAITATPASLTEVLLAEWLWAGSKSAFAGTIIILVIYTLDISRSPYLLLTPVLMLCIGLCFAAIGLLVTSFARSYEVFTGYFTLCLTPMLFLSGIFFPISQIPDWLQWLAQILPLYSAVSWIRPLFFGEFVTGWYYYLLVLMIYGGLAITLAHWRLTRRYYQD